jgi:hypothetical protein
MPVEHAVSGARVRERAIGGGRTFKAASTKGIDELPSFLIGTGLSSFEAIRRWVLKYPIRNRPIHCAHFVGASKAPGAVPVLFMSWAYSDRPGMTAELADAYTQAGNANAALVIPAGLAFARALERRPALILHAADKRHPSFAGTYLAACTAYATLFKKSPAGLKCTDQLGFSARPLRVELSALRKV